MNLVNHTEYLLALMLVKQSIQVQVGYILVGHVFCKATQEEQQITIGYSSGSKIWSSSYANLKDFVSWCDLNGLKYSTLKWWLKLIQIFDFFTYSEKLEEYPLNIYFADLSGESYAGSIISV